MLITTRYECESGAMPATLIPHPWRFTCFVQLKARRLTPYRALPVDFICGQPARAQTCHNNHNKKVTSGKLRHQT